MDSSEAEPNPDNPQQGRQTPDSIDQELDWLIEEGEQKKDQAGAVSEDEDNRNDPSGPTSVEAPQSARAASPAETQPAKTGSPHHSPEPQYEPYAPIERAQASQPQSETATGRSASEVANSEDEGPDSTYEDDFDMSVDQQKANEELKNMKIDLGYTEEEPPPEYDVSERVRQLNKELANDPEPDEGRDRTIKFSENPVSLVAPPPEYSGDEEDTADEVAGSGDAASPTEANRDSGAGSPSPRSAESGESTPRSSDGEELTPSEGAEKDILVERNGKFELLKAEELTSEERELYGVAEPHPPQKPRPYTANGGGSRARKPKETKQRSQSADAGNDQWAQNYNSPYALQEQEKKELARQQKEREKQERQQKELKQKMEEKRAQEQDDAFSAWLKKKKEQNSNRRKENGEQQQDEKSQEGEDAYREWLKTKQEQRKREKKESQEQDREVDEGWYTRPREDCDKAYKEWLKRKNAEMARTRTEDKQRSRIHRLLARRSRKSQQLARAIKQAQAYRYVDYYGYRNPVCSNSNISTTVSH